MILVTGASGRIGTAILRELSGASVPARALARGRARSPLRDEPGVQWIDGDAGDERVLAGALEGVCTVVLHSASAPGQVALQERVISAALSAGVARIVKLSIVGAADDAASDEARWHWRIEQRLGSTGVETCSVRVTRPMQALLHQASLLLTSGLLAGCQGTGQSADVDVRDVGAVLATLATAPRLDCALVTVTGPEAMDFAGMARLLSRQFNRPIRYVDCQPGDMLQCALAAGVDRWIAEDMVAWQTDARDGRYAIVHDTIERVTGRPPRRFEAFANELATSLRYANAPQRTEIPAIA
ncbi:MAG TPA: NAD(P)H-binding protein [Gemmatimonas sp.]|nr:NAD(P)H-binding protein [Gemmatimonas sp.]